MREVWLGGGGGNGEGVLGWGAKGGGAGLRTGTLRVEVEVDVQQFLEVAEAREQVEAVHHACDCDNGRVGVRAWLGGEGVGGGQVGFLLAVIVGRGVRDGLVVGARGGVVSVVTSARLGSGRWGWWGGDGLGRRCGGGTGAGLGLGMRVVLLLASGRSGWDGGWGAEVGDEVGGWRCDGGATRGWFLRIGCLRIGSLRVVLEFGLDGGFGGFGPGWRGGEWYGEGGLGVGTRIALLLVGLQFWLHWEAEVGGCWARSGEGHVDGGGVDGGGWRVVWFEFRGYGGRVGSSRGF